MNLEVIKERYVLHNLIGKGGMSEVLLCEDKLLKTYWAAKRIWKDSDEHALLAYEALKKETEMLVNLKHTSIPAIIDCLDDEKSYLVIMELVEGDSLRQMVLKESISEMQIMDWAVKLLRILHYLHYEGQQPIVYRDLKPENVLLKNNGELMLIDFGIAMYVKEDKINNTPCLGTRGYASKEQSSPGHIDCRSDLYSFGATLYYFYTKTVYNKQSIPSGALHNIMKKCLVEDVEKRYQSVDEIMRDITKVTRKKKIFRKPLLYSLVFLCFSGYAQIQFLQARKELYNEFLVNQEYEQAIQLDPSKKDAYLYIYTKYKKESIPEAIQKIENLSLYQLSSQHQDELYYDIAFDCFSIGSPEYYQQAATYLRLIQHKDVSTYIQLCDLLGNFDELAYEKVEDVLTILTELEKLADICEYPKLKAQYYEVLIRSYTSQLENLGMYAYESILRIAKKGVTYTIHENVDSSLYEYHLFFCEKEILGYGNLGQYLTVQGQKTSAIQQFQIMKDTYNEYKNNQIFESSYIEQKIAQLE